MASFLWISRRLKLPLTRHDNWKTLNSWSLLSKALWQMLTWCGREKKKRQRKILTWTNKHSSETSEPQSGWGEAGGRCSGGKQGSLVTLHQRFLNHTARFRQPRHQQDARGDICLDSREYRSVFQKEVGPLFLEVFLSQKICMASTGKCNSVVKTV